MPLFFSEPPVVLVALLGALGLTVAIAGLMFTTAARDNSRARAVGRVLLAVGGLLVLLAFAWLVVGFFLESPREEAVRRVSTMADAVTENDWPKFSENVSESFDAKGRKKADLKPIFDQGKQSRLRAVAWDFAPTDKPQTDSEVVIQFEGKVTAPSGEPMMRHFEATFVKDPDGKFRMKRYQAFEFGKNIEKVDVP